MKLQYIINFYYHFLENVHKISFKMGSLNLKKYFDMMVNNEAPKKKTRLNEAKPVVRLKKENGLNQKKAKNTIELEEEMKIENEKYFFCTLCKIDIHQKTEAYDHLGEF